MIGAARVGALLVLQLLLLSWLVRYRRVLFATAAVGGGLLDDARTLDLEVVEQRGRARELVDGLLRHQFTRPPSTRAARLPSASLACYCGLRVDGVSFERQVPTKIHQRNTTKRLKGIPHQTSWPTKRRLLRLLPAPNHTTRTLATTPSHDRPT